jgi:zona occludens toxin
MITLITGTPGAGKTLYAISKLLRELVGSTVKKTNDDGSVTDVPRRIMTNINGLLLDHELIGPDEGGGLADWHKWCKPGDVICYDEVQRSWTPRANGSKVPEYISALETHRHMGVDFILLTQNPMLIDRNVTALVGRHLHVRRFGGIGAAIVYEWDHCSRSLLFSKSIKKTPWKYDKSVFKLYKSAELHTKPKISVPPLAFVALFAVAGAAFAIPYASDRITGKATEAEKHAAEVKAKKHQQPAQTDPQHAQASGEPQDYHPPVFDAPAPSLDVPYPLESLSLSGVISGAGGRVSYAFTAARDGGPPALVTGAQLEAVGYTVAALGECAVAVSIAERVRSFVCSGGGFGVGPKAPKLPTMAADHIPPAGLDVGGPIRRPDPGQAQNDGQILRSIRGG